MTGDEHQDPILIERSSCVLTPAQVHDQQIFRNATYVCDTSVRDKNGNWSNTPVAVFYTDIKHPEGSNYFGLYRGDDGSVFICDALSATLDPIVGVLAPDNIVYFSRYRHDFRNIPGGFIDGGRDYLRTGDKATTYPLVDLQIVGKELKIVRVGRPRISEVK